MVQTRPPQDVDDLALLVRKFSDIVVLGCPHPVLFLISEVLVIERPQDRLVPKNVPEIVSSCGALVKTTTEV